MFVRFLLRSLALQAGVTALRRRDDGTAEDPEQATPQKFLVELSPGNDIEVLRQQIEELPGMVILKTFESEIFTGLSVDATHAKADSSLESLRGATQAWPMRTIKRANLPDRNLQFDDDLSAKNYSIHQYTGVDKAHAAGMLGKGAVVAVIDTGIDYNHPALGGGIGPGLKIASGYDFVGNEDWPIGPRMPDDDPMDQRGHGTHVAGIIAGKSDSFVGVAPDSTLLAYKVFTSLDGTDEEVLVESFLKAYEAGADIITASIGGPHGFSDGAWAMVASRLVDQGIIVTIAASNDGWVGPFFASSGSSGKDVLAVASMEPSTIAAEPFIAKITSDGGSKSFTFGYAPGDGSWDLQDYPLIPTSTNSSVTADACQPLPSGFPDLSNAVALIRRGGCDFAVKQANAEQFGAKYVLIYNDDGQFLAPFSWSPSQIGMMEANAGKAVVDAFAAGETVTVSFTHTSHRVGVHNAAGGRPSEFTSWGALYDLQIKPDISAPGGNIYSTEMNGRWGVRSGTSMATPYVAGIAALYVGRYGGRAVHGKGFGRAMFRRIVSSGGALPWSTTLDPPEKDSGYFAPVPQVGTGMVNAMKVLEYTTSLEFDMFGLNDTANFIPDHEMTITNNGEEDVEYAFGVQPAGGFEMYQPIANNGARDSIIRSLAELGEPIALEPTVALPQAITLAPGESRKVKVSFVPPSENARESEMPVYSGKILVTASNGESLSVPYFGVAFNLLEQVPDMFPRGSPSLSVDGDTYRWTFDLAGRSRSYPTVYATFEYGVSELRWDIFDDKWSEKQWQYPPVVGENGYIGSATSYVEAGKEWQFNPDTMNANDSYPFPVRSLSRTYPFIVGYYEFWWLGGMSDGTQISSGNYQMRFAALRPFGDPNNSTHWDVWELPQFNVARQG